MALIAAHRLLGELGTRRRDYTSAGDHLLSAAELAEHCQAPYELALVRLAQAELARATGDRPHARALLAQATQTCEELGARPAVDSANRLAATLDVASAAYPAGLTAREVEVLSLLVDGLSNREIADRLSVSHRTVMNHVSSILGKLGVASRTAAVTVALREGFILPR